MNVSEVSINAIVMLSVLIWMAHLNVDVLMDTKEMDIFAEVNIHLLSLIFVIKYYLIRLNNIYTNCSHTNSPILYEVVNKVRIFHIIMVAN